MSVLAGLGALASKCICMIGEACSVGRKRTPDTWCVVKDVDSDQLLKVEPTSQPSYLSSAKYQLIGRFATMEDAEQFILFRRLNAPCDKLAYLEKEYTLRGTPDFGAKVDMAQLEEKCEALRTSTGRTCFGKCKSLDGRPACAICYSDLPKTWELCATIDLIKKALAREG